MGLVENLKPLGPLPVPATAGLICEAIDARA